MFHKQGGKEDIWTWGGWNTRSSGNFIVINNLIILLVIYYQSDQEDVGCECSTHVREELFVQSFGRKSWKKETTGKV
jgi:hypothetical protein